MPEGHDPDPAGRSQRASASDRAIVGIPVDLSVGVTDTHAYTFAVAGALFLSAGPAAGSVAHVAGTGPAAHIGSRAAASGVAGQL